MRFTGDRATGRLLGVQLFGHRHAEIAKRIDIAATAIFHGMTVDAVSDLDLSYTPPLGSPWDAVQIGAQAWTRHASSPNPPQSSQRNNQCQPTTAGTARPAAPHQDHQHRRGCDHRPGPDRLQQHGRTTSRLGTRQRSRGHRRPRRRSPGPGRRYDAPFFTAGLRPDTSSSTPA